LIITVVDTAAYNAVPVISLPRLLLFLKDDPDINKEVKIKRALPPDQPMLSSKIQFLID
jgi:hypothetical protein